MTAPTDLEQLLLELTNHARLDPMANAALYLTSYAPLTSNDPDIQRAMTQFKVDGDDLLAAFEGLRPVGPLAWNTTLAQTAGTHNAYMIATGQQAHQTTGEKPLGDRVKEAGYAYKALGENIYAYAESVIYAHAGFMVDWGEGPGGMQSPAGHRNSLMSGGYTEIGIAIDKETNANTMIGPLVVTQDIGARGKYFITGVAYDDRDQNQFYSRGEGLGDLTVSIGSAATTSYDTGGYTLESGSGAKTILLTGAGLASAVTVKTTIAGENLKLDVVDGTTLLTSGSIVVEGAVSEIHGLGVRGMAITAGAGAQTIVGTPGADTLNGGAGDDIFKPGAGDDAIDGGAGKDIVVYDLARAAYAVTASGGAALVAPAAGSQARSGADTVSNVEVFRFADGDYAWNAATGTLTSGTQPQPQPTASEYRLFASTGFVGKIGDASAAGSVVADHGFQHIIVLPGSGDINFSGGFNRGGKIIELPGDAADYTIARSGSSAVFSHGGADYVIPAGTAGLMVLFDDGARVLRIDAAAQKLMIGTQVFDAAPAAITAPPTRDPLPTGAQDGVTARLFIADNTDLTLEGDYSIIGTTDAERVTYLGGALTLDSSFNRGGDEIALPREATDYTAHRDGSNLVLTSIDGRLTIPVGANGIDIDFGGDARVAKVDGARGLVLGDQPVTANPAPVATNAAAGPVETAAAALAADMLGDSMDPVDASGWIDSQPASTLGLDQHGWSHLTFG